MISSDLVNMLFTSFAEFVSRLTDREVKFQQLKYGEGMPGATLKMDKFLKEATEAFENPSLRKLGVLEPGKLYCLQIDMSKAHWELIETLAECLGEQDIRLVVIDKDMNFVSVPKGYEMVKKK